MASRRERTSGTGGGRDRTGTGDGRGQASSGGRAGAAGGTTGAGRGRAGGRAASGSPARGVAGAPDGSGGTGAAGHGQLPAVRVRLTELIEPVIVAAGFEMDALSVSRAGRRHLVRVVVDGDTVDSGAIAEVAREVSSALDEAEQAGGEVVPGGYTLEVSSPGVDRPLTQPRHWRRNVGRLVKVKLGDRMLTGRVRSADDEGVTLDVSGTARTALYEDLGPGRVQIEFTRVDELPDADLAEFGDDSDDDFDGDEEGVDEE